MCYHEQIGSADYRGTAVCAGAHIHLISECKEYTLIPVTGRGKKIVAINRAVTILEVITIRE